ncbi:putative phage protein gp47/JayE [Paenibacillus sp. V4I3]|uniref:baseplate J/gp47 family protein n=1 Tax=Paenibacillus sp. V4I3 TaxID=3042305 RepID=UPI0027880C04|nr:baseplate J/gp47 family protein [Paenibacillus sp. V4I3]MDQ0876755.1 putative phage protein gp47/JayE [Paenibacillus sp. V4I3]
MALDRNGFKRKRFVDLFSEMEVKAKEVYGQQINTSERAVMGIILRIFAWFLSFVWQLAEDVYNSAYPNTANGTSLKKLGPYAGIKSLQPIQATGTITLTGTDGFIQTSGFRVQTNDEVIFVTTESITLSGGTGTGAIRAIQTGKTGNVSAGQINEIVNPNTNITAATNAEATTGGREDETDAEFRGRFAISSEGRGKATIGSIRAELLKVSGVRAATVIENYSNVTDSAGRPSKSFECYVLGGSPIDIGQTILDTKAAGIEPHGSESIAVNDDAGFSHIMKFSYADEINTHVKFTITKDARYPADGDALLKSAALKYIGGLDADGTLYIGLNMGDNVVQSRLISAAYSVEGVSDVQVQISTDGITWSEENLDIAPNEVAPSTHTLISVVVGP